VIYAFHQLSRQEIAAMIEVFDIKETRFYQETREEGREEATRALVLRQLTHKFGQISEADQNMVDQLSVEVLEVLAEALLDFAGEEDFHRWLVQQRDVIPPSQENQDKPAQDASNS
jgi:predicted transposase YdaD